VDSVEVNGGSEENFFQLFVDGVLYVHTKTGQRQIRINLEKGQHTVAFVWRQGASRSNKRDVYQSSTQGVLTFLTNKLNYTSSFIQDCLIDLAFLSYTLF
jgi:hypothetical protein